MTPAANMSAAPMPAGGAGKGGMQQPAPGGGKGGMNRGPGGNAQNNPGQQVRPGMGGPMGGMGQPQTMPSMGGINQNLMNQQWQNLTGMTGGSMGGNWQNIMQTYPGLGSVQKIPGYGGQKPAWYPDSGVNMGGWGNDVMPSPPQAPPVQHLEVAPHVAAPTPAQPVKPQFNAAGLPAGGLLANLYGGG